jgi:hypothetical protein
VLLDELELDAAHLGDGHGDVHVRGRSPVQAVDDLDVIQALERACADGGLPALHGSVEIGDHVAHLGNAGVIWHSHRLSPAQRELRITLSGPPSP